METLIALCYFSFIAICLGGVANLGRPDGF